MKFTARFEAYSNQPAFGEMCVAGGAIKVDDLQPSIYSVQPYDHFEVLRIVMVRAQEMVEKMITNGQLAQGVYTVQAFIIFSSTTLYQKA